MDDDPGLLRLVERALKRESFITVTASSGQEAIAWLAQNHADLVLLDLKLQDIEGKELINRLVDIGRLVPFIIITGQGDERVAVEVMKRGALDYLVKDAQFIEFVPTVVKRALAQIEKDKRLAFAEEQALELQKEVLEVSENEQRRIGRDLHDGLGQHLTALELLSQTLLGKLKSAAPALVQPAEEITRQIRETIKQTRLISHNLSPVPLDADGLMIALEELAAGTQGASVIDCNFICARPFIVSNANVATHLYRIAQEAVNNALKHSRAKTVTIRLKAEDREWTMSVEDNGKGLDAKPNQKSTSSGLGLRIMKYRAQLIGASIEIESPSIRKTHGVKITCKLPRKP